MVQKLEELSVATRKQEMVARVDPTHGNSTCEEALVHLITVVLFLLLRASNLSSFEVSLCFKTLDFIKYTAVPRH
jgi:hypothetical protein